MIRRIALLMLAVLTAMPALGQDEGGVRADLTVGLGGIWDRDPSLNGVEGVGLRGLGSLEFSVSSKTRTQSISFEGSHDRIQQFDGRTDVRLSYSRKTKSSALGLTAGYKDLPAGVQDFASDLVEGQGTIDLAPRQTGRREADATIRFRTGIDRPVGLDLSYGEQRRKTFGLSVTRSTRRALKSVVALRLNSRARSRLFWEQTWLESSGTSRLSQDERRVGVGFDYKLSELSEISVDFLGADLKEARSGSNIAQNGLEWRVNLVRKTRDGHVSFTGKSEQTEQGELRRLQFGIDRSVSKHALELVAGLAHLQGNATEPTLYLRYRGTWASGAIHAVASRDFAGSDETGETRVATTLNLGLEHDIGPRGTLDLSFAYLESGATRLTPARSAERLRAAYRHELRRDWGVVAGAQRRVRRDTGVGRTGSNSVFLTFERRFSGGM